MSNEWDFVESEVNRCLNCVSKPCQKACPLGNDMPEAIKLMKANEFQKAFELLCDTTVLPSVCGRICPHEKQCQSSCTRKYQGNTIETGRIEAFLGDMALDYQWSIPYISDELLGKNVAVVGSGPSSLTCAAYLARRGAYVVIYEKHPKLGGLLRYGIPDFRLDKKLLYVIIENILDIGINTIQGVELGFDITLDDLKEEYDAIFLGIGANVSKKMNIPGEELNGVLGANDFLEYGEDVDFMGKDVFVSGGGNVAIDTARTVKRLGARDVTIVYRRSEEDMPAELKEIEEAKKEGIQFAFHANMIAIHGDEDGNVKKIECIKTKYEDDASVKGRNRKLVNIENTNFKYWADYVFMAVGSKPEEELLEELGLELTDKGNIAINENYQTSDEKVFAGGDIVGEKATIAWAARSGRNAAEKMKEWLLR